MNEEIFRLVSHFATYGVLHREGVKNNFPALHQLMKQRFVSKTYKNGRVFYELAPKALPLLEQQRKRLLEGAKLMFLLHPHSSVYSSLTGDVRFLDENRPEARDFLFLGDWQLQRPVVPSQLELAKLRFYTEKVPPRIRRKKVR